MNNVLEFFHITEHLYTTVATSTFSGGENIFQTKLFLEDLLDTMIYPPLSKLYNTSLSFESII